MTKMLERPLWVVSMQAGLGGAQLLLAAGAAEEEEHRDEDQCEEDKPENDEHQVDRVVGAVLGVGGAAEEAVDGVDGPLGGSCEVEAEGDGKETRDEDEKRRSTVQAKQGKETGRLMSSLGGLQWDFGETRGALGLRGATAVVGHWVARPGWPGRCGRVEWSSIGPLLVLQCSPALLDEVEGLCAGLDVSGQARWDTVKSDWLEPLKPLPAASLVCPNRSLRPRRRTLAYMVSIASKIHDALKINGAVLFSTIHLRAGRQIGSAAGPGCRQPRGPDAVPGRMERVGKQSKPGIVRAACMRAAQQASRPRADKRRTSAPQTMLLARHDMRSREAEPSRCLSARRVLAS
ncbi:hypothetical protein G7046_g9588 [Stylonectria norvegica]|nr:hypothetical protein G7046_g9588 [Stylonectria norvegica]